MNEPIIKITDLSIGYKYRNGPPKVISTGLNLELLPGEMVCLLGPNGAGKSTLMRTIAGLQPPISGHIILNGTALPTLLPADLARQISLVLTERIEGGNLTVREVVGLGRIPYTGWLGKLTDLDLEKIKWALHVTETTLFQDQNIHSLSDGERQKVMLARALAQDTPLILLDEPTAHLDLPSRVEMMRLLHQLARKMKKAILLSTHELDLALQAADKLWLIKSDGTLATGSPEDLVLNGSFESAFSKPGFYFDKKTGSFTIHQESADLEIFIHGAPSPVFWTKRALKREGISAIDQNTSGKEIHVSEERDTFQFILNWKDHTSVHSSIEALLKTVNALRC